MMTRSFVTALSGLNAFSNAVAYTSDNLANVKTVGYKRVDANFKDWAYTTSGGDANHNPGGVVAKPGYRVTSAGVVSTSDVPTYFAVSGGIGMIAVTEPETSNSGETTFNANVRNFTRSGDFSPDKEGYFVNSQGQYLLAVPESPAFSGQFATSPTLADAVPAKVDNANYSVYPGKATSEVNYNANFPASMSSGESFTSEIPIYDGTGISRTINVTYTRSATTANTWDLAATVPGFTTAPTVTPSATSISFDENGRISSPADGKLTYAIDWGSAVASDTTPILSASSGFSTFTSSDTKTTPPSGTQSVGVIYAKLEDVLDANGGTSAQMVGSTQYAGASMEVRSISDYTGAATGLFTSAVMNNEGEILFRYSNGKTTAAYKVPLISFNDANALNRLTGGTSFGENDDATGKPMVTWSGDNRAGRIVASAVEESNVDMSDEMVKLIQAQRAYTSNAKVISTSDEMLITARDLKN